MLEGREEEAGENQRQILSRHWQLHRNRLFGGAAVEHQIVHGRFPIGEPELALVGNAGKRLIAQDEMRFRGGQQRFRGMIESD